MPIGARCSPPTLPLAFTILSFEALILHHSITCWLFLGPFSLQAWRQHFVLEENMLEVECPAVTPEIVLKASGHVDRWVLACMIWHACMI